MPRAQPLPQALPPPRHLDEAGVAGGHVQRHEQRGEHAQRGELRARRAFGPVGGGGRGVVAHALVHKAHQLLGGVAAEGGCVRLQQAQHLEPAQAGAAASEQRREAAGDNAVLGGGVGQSAALVPMARKRSSLWLGAVAAPEG